MYFSNKPYLSIYRDEKILVCGKDSIALLVVSMALYGPEIDIISRVEVTVKFSSFQEPARHLTSKSELYSTHTY